jgi:outer membrane receptor for ferrienterochelin and colicins
VNATRSILAASLLLGVQLAAQGTGVVYGAVTDSSGTGLPRAVVRATNRDQPSRVIASALTDESGRYRLAALPAGWLALDAAAIGYRSVLDSVRLSAGDSARLDFRLAPRAILLMPTIVTAAKRSQLLDQAVTSVALVDQLQVTQQAVNRIDEAVDRAPGVQFISGQVNIRGSSGFAEGLGSRVLLLVDGVPANQGDRGGINWDVIPVDRVERVEVVKGAGSALYGSSAFGGVVNVITRDLPEGWHGRLRATLGTFANPPQDVWKFRDFTGIQDGLDVAGSYGRDPVRAGFSIGARHSDGYRQQDRADHWQVTGKTDWRPEPVTQVSMSGAWASDQYGVPWPWCTTGACADSGESIQPFKIETANLGYRTRSDKGYLTTIITRTPSATLTWLARGSWLRTRFTDWYPNRPPPYTTSDYAIANRYGIEGRLVSQRGTSRTVTVGVEGAISDVWSNVFSGASPGATGTHTQGEYAAYGEAEQEMGPTRLTLGARSDFLTVDGAGLSAFVSPRVGVVWPTETGSWRASVGRAYRAASLGERFVTTYYSGFQVIPNPALVPEDGWSSELGRSWTGVPWLRADAAVFWTEARRLIEPQADLQGQLQFQNLERARLVGLDLSVTGTPFTSRLSTSAAYQYLYAQQLASATTPQLPLPFRPKHLLTLSTDYTLHHLSVGADFRYSSRYEREYPIYPNDRRYTVRVLDLRAGWSSGSLDVRLKAANVFNYIYNLAPRTLEPVRTVTLVVTVSS